jgi:prolyl-tRNA editing enzyme YbaK/EbsC (Cys-tRNA(Pro) deacylase)
MQVFFSYGDSDAMLAHEIAGHFPPWLKTWIDEDRLLLGVELTRALDEAIYTGVDYVVLLFRRDAAASAELQRKARWALEEEERLGRTFVLPVMLDDGTNPFSDPGFVQLAPDDTVVLAKTIEDHIVGWMSELLRTAPWGNVKSRVGDSSYELGDAVESFLSATRRPWRTEVESLLVTPFLIALGSAREGRIALTPAQYYRRVTDEMRDADDTAQIIAVSTLSSDLWAHDADQTHYAAQNVETVRRGASIRRLFILPEAQTAAYEGVIREQREAGISTRIGPTSLLARVPDLEDFVLFETGQSGRGYIAHPSIDGSQRIRSGSLVLSELALEKRRAAFEAAWGEAEPPEVFFKAGGSTVRQATERQAPGKQLQALHLNAPVITCEEAARARGIPLAQELKTLLLQTHNGIVAIHLPGDGVLSLRKVKARIETAQAYLADPEELQQLGLTPGTVSAVLDPIWSMPHLISRRLLRMNKVTTNNGTLTGYFEFDPGVLAEAADVIVDDFEK